MTIKQITREGICYESGLGSELFLNLEECNENWLSYRKRVDSLNNQQIESLRKKDKTVGQRDNDKSCFIEFFSRPFVRFEFKMPEQIDEFKKLRNAIWSVGWNTIDLG